VFRLRDAAFFMMLGLENFFSAALRRDIVALK